MLERGDDNGQIMSKELLLGGEGTECLWSEVKLVGKVEGWLETQLSAVCCTAAGTPHRMPRG